MTSLLQGSSSGSLRALHWTLSAGEESRRHALLRLLPSGGAASVFTLPKDPRSGAEEASEAILEVLNSNGKVKSVQHPKRKQRLQKSQLRLQTSKALQTPLHWLCAHDALETASGECLGGWPSRPLRPSASVSALARELMQQWPLAVLMPDAVGLWPFSHFGPDFCDSQTPHSPQRELLLTLLHSLASLECQHPEVMMMLDPEELRSLRSLLQRIETSSCDTRTSKVLEAFRRFTDGARLGRESSVPRRVAALEAEEQRKDAWQWQMRGKELQHRLGALRRLSGQRSSPDKAPRSFAEAMAEWHRKRESYEERLQQLRFELGRIPSQRPQGVTVTEVALNAVPDAAFWEAEGTLSRASDAELLIASLRRQRLGDGAGPGCGVRRALGAAVERLAVDLYEMESHFVYELVQNADDNCYDATGEDPWLRLELHRGSAGSFFVSVNNELGLTTQDVRAICDVNASSKRGRQGVTGHKGIGWKSCFQVSDCPYMLSGAFTFKFDVKSLGTLGYVTPTWVGEEELHSLPQLVWEAYYAGYTVTYLPLRQGTEDSVELAMAHLEEHLPCLLFLRRLKSLELCGGETVRLAVEDQGSDCVAVHRSTGVPSAVPSAVNAEAAEAQSTWQFLVHRHRVLLEEKELILTLAFPDGPTASKLPPQALYCLLPVRKLGFCFCLDGPFELIASRGDIHEGSRRNQALCEELPAAFAGALERHRSLAPRALELLGPPPPEPFWQRVHSSVLDQLQGTACVPLEEGGLEEPERCLLRPAGLAGDASRLIPSSLLWCACGKRWAAASNMGALEEMTFEHVVQVLRHRDDEWPHGLCASWRSKDVAAKHFRCLFAYLGEVLETADVAAEVLQELWHLELLPAELLEEPDDPAAVTGSTGSPRLYRLSDGVFAPRHQLGAVPCWAWKKLVDVKLLKLLDEAFIGPESTELSFVQRVLVPLSPEVLYQQIREHFVLEVHPHEVLWALLALLQHLFLQEATPAEGWHALGEVLRLPSLCGTSVRASRAVLPTFLGCALETAPLQRAARMATAACGRRAAEITACCTGGLPLGFSFLDTAYLTYGEPVAWEAFFVALGVRPLRPRRVGVVNVANVGRVPEAKKLPQVASSSKNAQIWAQRKVEQLSQAQLCDMLISVHPKQLFEDEVFVPFEAFEATGTLPKNLVATEWWQRVVEMPKEVLDYLRCRLEYAAAWLRELAVPIKGQRTRPVREHLLEQTDLARLCGGFLPVLQLPKGGFHRVGEVKQCLLSLGLLGDATGANCLRCLKAISTTCQDVSLYVALYQRLEQHLDTLEPEELAELKTLVFVPGHGMQTSGACAWSDSALMQLAEVPALCAHYERHGPGMEKCFTRILEHSDFRFDATQLLCALRRMVLRVNEGESAVPMCDGLDGMVEMVSEIYRLMSLHLKDQPSEVTLFRRSFGTERLLLLRLPGYPMPKRLRAEEAFWQLEPDLQKVESLQALALQQRFDEDLKPFFLAVGVHQEMTRPVLRQLLQRPQEVMSMMRWSGLNVGDVEDLGMLQTSSNFRPPDWHADDSADESTDAGTTTEGGGLEPDFQPPRHAGGPRPPPAIRSSEELERLEREEHQRRAEREQRQQRHRERQQRIGEQGYFASAGAGGATGATGATDATGATGAGAGEGPRRPSGAKSEAEETETTETESTLEDLHHLRVRLEELTSESHTRQQESFELRTRWAQAEEDADRYMKILEQFYAADESLRVVG